MSWLDSNVPNWRQLVKREKLKIKSVSCCILGQIGWHNIPSVTIEECVEMGFCAASSDVSDFTAEYAVLQAAWEAELAR